MAGGCSVVLRWVSHKSYTQLHIAQLLTFLVLYDMLSCCVQRYRSRTRSRSRSDTPPHWKREQAKLVPMCDAVVTTALSTDTAASSASKTSSK